MTPAQIVQRIIDLGLNEDAPDTGLQTKALGWLNSAYEEAYGLASTFGASYLFASTNVTITSGSGTLASAPRRILLVRDTETNRILKQSDPVSIAYTDPTLTRTGNPAKFYLSGATTIKTYPTNSTTLDLQFIPAVAPLTIDGAEDTIKIPPAHHQLLIWASLLEGMLFERGFGNDGLIQAANVRKKELLDNYMRDLRENTLAPQRVVGHDF